MKALTTWKPMAPLAAFDWDLDFDRMVSRFFGDRASGLWAPPADIVEEDDRYLVRMDIPGLKREEITVSVENDHLTVRGHRKTEREEKNENYLRSERFSGEFVRSFRLGKRTSTKDVKATYENGVLEIAVPKAEEAKPRTIEVQ